MKTNEVKLESDKRRLKEVLDASESRTIKLELQRRSLEGELQRSRLGLSDREAQAQALQDRVDSLQRQVGPLPYLKIPHWWAQCQVLYRGDNPPSSPVRQILASSSFHRWMNEGSGK